MKKHKVAKVAKEGCINQPKTSNLTPVEQEVLRLLREEFLTPKQVSYRRQTTHQAVYKIIKKLKKKGALSKGIKEVAQKQGRDMQPSNKIRLHGQEFNIKLLFQNPKYQELLSKSNLMYLGGHTIKLFKNSVEIYAGEGISFYADTADRAFSKSIKYWTKFFKRLEWELKVILIKPRTRNIKQVNAHYSRGDSEISEKAIEEKKQIRIYAAEDGKLAFVTDNSFGFKEDEALHPITAKPDRNAIDKQVNDWRLNNPPTNSQLATHVYNVTQNQVMFDSNFKSHLQILKKLGDAVDELVKKVGELGNGK
jgi:DNA-binding CsgD family transcriptional regulator